MKYSNLTSYLPYFRGDQNTGGWHGGEQKDGVVLMPYVVYDKIITEFIREFSRSSLADRNYNAKMEACGWWDEKTMENAVSKMSAEDIGTCITAIWRRDRFSEGTILHFLKNGILGKFLARLKELDEDK